MSSDPGVLQTVDLTAYLPAPTKWEREYQAFLGLLPELLKAHEGKYVAVHEGRVVDVGEDKVALALGVYEKYGYVPIYVGLVATRPLPPERCPSFHLPGEEGPG
jgi:hypothetical protein